MPTFAPSITKRLDQVTWLSRLGNREQVNVPHWPLAQVSSLAEAKKGLVSDGWEHLSEDASGDQSAYLSLHEPKIDSEWNDWVIAGNRVLDEHVTYSLKTALEQLGLDKKVLDLVLWQLSGAIFELQMPQLRIEPFFTRLLAIYEQGHLPCGWRGTKPPPQSSRLVGDYVKGGVVLYF